MRKLILYTALSFDHFIADADGGIEWLSAKEFTLPDEDYGYTLFYKSIDTTIMGNNTYKKILGFDVPFPYPDKKNYVLSRSVHANTKYVEFLHDHCIKYIKKLKVTKGKDIWLVGGSELNTLFHQQGLIDELILTYIPVKLKSGIPLFATDNVLSCYELLDTRTYKNGIIQKIFYKK